MGLSSLGQYTTVSKINWSLGTPKSKAQNLNKGNIILILFLLLIVMALSHQVSVVVLLAIGPGDEPLRA